MGRSEGRCTLGFLVMVFMSLRLKARVCAAAHAQCDAHRGAGLYFEQCELLGLYLTAHLQLPSRGRHLLVCHRPCGRVAVVPADDALLDFYEHSDHDSSKIRRIPGDGEIDKETAVSGCFCATAVIIIAATLKEEGGTIEGEYSPAVWPVCRPVRLRRTFTTGSVKELKVEICSKCHRSIPASRSSSIPADVSTALKSATVCKSPYAKRTGRALSACFLHLGQKMDGEVDETDEFGPDRP